VARCSRVWLPGGGGGGKARGVGVPVTVYDSFLRFALFAIASAAFCSAAAFRFAAGWRAAASRPRALSSSIFLAFRASRSRCWLNVVSPAASVTAPSPVARRCHTSFTTATGPWPRVARNDLLGVCSSRSTPTSLPSLSTTGSSTCPEPPGLLTNAGDPFRFPLGTRAAPRTFRHAARRSSARELLWERSRHAPGKSWNRQTVNPLPYAEPLHQIRRRTRILDYSTPDPPSRPPGGLEPARGPPSWGVAKKLYAYRAFT
jgi:hypothetical protein